MTVSSFLVKFVIPCLYVYFKITLKHGLDHYEYFNNNVSGKSNTSVYIYIKMKLFEFVFLLLLMDSEDLQARVLVIVLAF